MKIELTHQQEQAVQQGRPVEVVDPASARTFVVMARELYERVRALLEGSPERRPAAAAVPATATPAVPPAMVADGPPRIRLRDLPTPPEVAEEVARLCKKYTWSRREVEVELKLQYYFGGQPLYVLRSPEGPIVVPIEERYRNTPDLRYVLLTPDERSRACYTIPSRWNDTAAEI